MQRERHRILAAARGDAVEQQLLLAVHHVELVDHDLRGVEQDFAGENLPRLVAAGDVRGKNPQIDDAAVGSVLVGHRGAEPDESRDAAQGVVEACRELHAVLPRAARQREARKVQHPCIEILGRGVDRQRVAAVRGVDRKARGEHAPALDVLRRCLERQLVAGRIEQQLQRRAVGDLKSRRHGVGHGVEIADVDRQQREVVGHGGLAFRRRLLPLFAAQHRQVFPRAPAQVFEDGAVAGFRPERDVGEVRAQFHELAPLGVLARDGHAGGRDLLVVVAVAGVGHLNAAVQIVERTPSGGSDDAARELRHRVAAVDVQPGQIGVPQVHREVVARHGVVQVDRAEEVEVEVGIAGRDASVELAVAQAAVEPQRIVDIAVEPQLRDVARDVGVGHSLADHAVDIGREGGVAQQIATVEQFAQPEVARLDVAPHAAQTALERVQLQVAGDVAHLRRGTQLHVERREQSPETGIEVDLPGVAQHADQLVREFAARDGEGQFVHRPGRGAQAGNRQVETGLPDVGKPLHRGVGHERRPLADLHAPDPAREIGHHAGDLDVYVGEIHMPVAQLRGEKGDIVGRNGRIAHRGVDAHLADEILVLRPRVARQRDERKVDVRTRRDDRGVLEAQTALRHVEPPGQVVQHEAAAFAGRKGRNGGVNGLPVDREIVHAGRDAVEVHVREVDAVLRIAMVEPFEAEVHVLDRGLLQREAEIALLGFVGVGNAVDDLFDVHLPAGRLPQVKPRVGDLAAAQLQPAAEDAETRDEGVELPDVKQRVALVVLDIEALDPDLREDADVHAVDRHGGLQLARDEARGPVHRVVLHGGNVEQQRERHGNNYQQQNRRREHLSQYFYTFAHQDSYITCKFSENS